MKKKKSNRSVTPALVFLCIAIVVFVVFLVLSKQGDQPSSHSEATQDTTELDSSASGISLPLVDHITSDAEVSAITTETESQATDVDFSTVCSLDTTTSPPETENDTTTEADIPPVVWNDSHTDSDRYAKDDETLFFTTISRPLFQGGNPSATQRINDYLSNYAEDFIRITSEDRLLSEESYEGSRFGFEAHERSASYSVYAEGRVVSIIFHVYQNSGGADASNTVKAFTFDLTTGNVLSFSDYIGKDQSFGTNYILTIFRQMIDQSPSDYYDDAKDILSSSVSLFDYYLTSDGVVLFFNPGVLSAKAHGVDSYTVAYSDLGK